MRKVQFMANVTVRDIPDDVLEIETNSAGILRDFDTYHDYETEINKIQ